MHKKNRYFYRFFYLHLATELVVKFTTWTIFTTERTFTTWLVIKVATYWTITEITLWTVLNECRRWTNTKTPFSTWSRTITKITCTTRTKPTFRAMWIICTATTADIMYMHKIS